MHTNLVTPSGMIGISEYNTGEIGELLKLVNYIATTQPTTQNNLNQLLLGRY
jgi:hypothetical protein